MSSTYKDIKKFTGVLQRASGYLKVNKVNTELLATLVEMFFVSQEVSESIAEKLGYTIDVCELECFCTKCQVFLIQIDCNSITKSDFPSLGVR